MNRKNECVRVFLWAAAIAYALYMLTLPEGLPWGVAHPLASAWMWVALAAGLLGALVTRYCGWRIGAAVAIVWTFLPGVWNRAILGDRVIAFTAFGICGLWLLNVILLFVFRKAIKTRAAAQAQGFADISNAAKIGRRGWKNWLASWGFFAVAVLYAIVSITAHDYRIGEAASVFARGVVEAAGERVIVLNGVLDAQAIAEVEKSTEDREKGGSMRTVSPLPDENARTNILAWAKREWPSETNLWLAADISARAFLEAATAAHPERFYLMNGSSTTLAGLEKRWKAFKPYLKSRDAFVPVARRLFGHEGNAVGNAIVDATACRVGKDETSSFLTRQAAASTAYALYRRIYEEIDPGNASALFNLNEMVRRGHKVSGDEKKWVTDKVEAFFKDEAQRRYVREIVKICGPVRTDPAVVEQMRQEAEQRTQERIASGEKIELPSEVKDVFEQNDKMVAAMEKDDRATAAKIAREILSKPGWRTWGPANAVMGEILSDEGDYAAAEAFFGIAIANEKETPDVVVNNYADVLMKLGKLDEAERVLRDLIAKRDERAWMPRFTLAEVLTKKGGKVEGGMVEGIEAEVRELVVAVMKYAPDRVKKMMRDLQRKGEVLK